MTYAKPFILSRIPLLWMIDGSHGKIECFKSKLLESSKTVVAYTSPKSGTRPGLLSTSKVKDHIKSTVSSKRGVILKSIIESHGSKTVLELGTNLGFSGCYFLSTGARLVTIEGSRGLCEIAKENLSRISNNFEVICSLFDDAIDSINMKFDAVFIDGQHNKESTIHYIGRVKPLLNEGGIIILDDIRWSNDMEDMWECVQKKYKTIDFISIGLILT